MKKFTDKVNESNIEKEEFNSFLEEHLLKINNLETFEDLKKHVMESTMGFLMPLNPIDPIRSALREKIYEIRDKYTGDKDFKSYLTHLEGERKDINIPPGAVC